VWTIEKASGDREPGTGYTCLNGISKIWDVIRPKIYGMWDTQTPPPPNPNGTSTLLVNGEARLDYSSLVFVTSLLRKISTLHTLI